MMKLAYTGAVALLLSWGLHAATPPEQAPSSEAARTTSSVARHTPTPVATADRPGAKPFAFPSTPTAFVTLRPTTTADVYDAADITPPGTGRLSLREAFAVANRLNVEVAILLARNAVYRLERCGPFEAPVNETNELTHTANKQLTINGNAATLFQDCEGAGVIVQQGGDQLLNLVDFTIAGGRSRHVPAGGVWSSGTGEVRITNAVVIDNQLESRSSSAGRVASTVSAGGVASNGDITISGATFSHNSGGDATGAVAALGSVKAIKSSFYDNTGGSAGAITGGKSVALGTGAQGPPAFTGVTPDGITLVYSTLNENTRPALQVTGGALTSFASVIAARGTGILCDLGGSRAESLGANYTSGGSGCGIGTGPRDTVDGPDPQLTVTRGLKQVDVYAPASGSALVDVIASSECMPLEVRSLVPVYSGGSSDELGVPRPQGRGCDIGAVEAIHVGSLAREVGTVALSDFPLPTRWASPKLGLEDEPGAVRVTTVEDVAGEAGRVSLRDALQSANRAAGPTTIVLEPRKVYRLTRCEPPQAAVDNETNDLVYSGNQPLRLEGNGSAIVQTCDGSGVLSIFAESQVTLSDVTIAGGRSVIHPGGGIYLAAAGELRLVRSWLTDNTSVAAGGGIAAFGNVLLYDSTVSANHSAEVGGGVIGTADVTAVNSSFFDNTADLAIGAIGNHSGRLTLLFSTIAYNSAPNVAVGSLAAFGSVIASYLPPRAPPVGFGGPPGGGGAPASGGPPGGFPPPADCAVEQPVRVLEGNYATDRSCGFANTGPDPQLVRNRKRSPTYLAPARDSPLVHLLSREACEPYRGSQDEVGHPRPDAEGCASGAISNAMESAGLADSGTSTPRGKPHTPRPGPL